MPTLRSRNRPAPTAATRGVLAPTDGADVPIATVKEESAKVNMVYICRAYSEENRPGFHPNEDRFFCEEHPVEEDGNVVDMFTVGVMDGHDGSLAADMVGEQMPPIVINNCFRDGLTVHDSHKNALQNVEDKLEETGSTAGCCVNSCVVWGKYLWCANLGDCRTIYIPLSSLESADTKPGTFCWMSRDLKASMAYEQERIQACGWKVTNGRVEGLEPTRTIGDFDIKQKVPEGVISIVPETRCIDIVAEGKRKNPSGKVHQGILIQGTDGIWDVTTSEDINSLLSQRTKNIRALQRYLERSPLDGNFDPEHDIAVVLERLAQDIVIFAVSRGSSDDCTAIVTAVSVAQKPEKKK